VLVDVPVGNVYRLGREQYQPCALDPPHEVEVLLKLAWTIASLNAAFLMHKMQTTPELTVISAVH
jgi:hypothetical protein